ncbi:hypothetical protein [Desulfosarcina cetonica]|nr:hypothetical protein [Desulfosarcina cetonica]
MDDPFLWCPADNSLGQVDRFSGFRKFVTITGKRIIGHLILIEEELPDDA